jgi:hypothetical protein
MWSIIVSIIFIFIAIGCWVKWQEKHIQWLERKFKKIEDKLYEIENKSTNEKKIKSKYLSNKNDD